MSLVLVTLLLLHVNTWCASGLSTQESASIVKGVIRPWTLGQANGLSSLVHTTYENARAGLVSARATESECNAFQDCGSCTAAVGSSCTARRARVFFFGFSICKASRAARSPL